jgi:hypothetical protein
MRPPGLEAIEALIWSTGTRDQVLVTRILRAVTDYARAADCPPDPAARAEILHRAAAPGQRTLEDVLGEEGAEWRWPR